MNVLLKQAQQTNAAVDMTQTTKGGGVSRTLPKGNALARFVGYIEKGSHPQEFGGKVKDPAPLFELQFVIVGGSGLNSKGEREAMVIDDKFQRVNTYNIGLSRNVKSNAVKIFNAMNWTKDATTFPEMLGRLFMLKVDHVEKDGNIRHSIDWKSILPPVDPMTGQPYDAPEAPDDMYRLFLWDMPSKEQWESLFIDGERDDGSSKNYLQEELLKATDFLGSPLEQLLSGSSAPTLVHETTEVPEA